jgi:hypothetical protein
MVFLCYLDANIILGDNLSDEGTFSTQFFGCLVEFFWVSIGDIQDSPGSVGDGIVTKLLAELPQHTGASFARYKRL